MHGTTGVKPNNSLKRKDMVWKGVRENSLYVFREKKTCTDYLLPQNKAKTSFPRKPCSLD